jgi:hypothetical protein
MKNPARYDRKTDRLSAALCQALHVLTDGQPTEYVEALRRAADYLNDEADDYARELNPPPPPRRP